MAITAERRLKKVVIDLLRDPTFADMAGIFMLGKKSVMDGLPTAATDGRDEWYGREFVDALGDKDALGLAEGLTEGLRLGDAEGDRDGETDGLNDGERLAEGLCDGENDEDGL